MNKTALSTLLNLLSKQDYTQTELERKLKQKKYSANEIESAISEIQNWGYQSDVRYCSQYALSKSNSGYGINYIKQKLSEKGISQQIISSFFDSYEINWHEILDNYFSDYLRKNIHKIPAPNASHKDKIHFKNRLYNHLINRGHQSSLVATLINNLPNDFYYLIHNIDPNNNDLEFDEQNY